MNINKFLLWTFCLMMAAEGCDNVPVDGPADTPESPVAEEYLRLNLISGSGYKAATNDVVLSRAVWDDNNGNWALFLKWESVAIDSDKTNDLALVVSDGEKPIPGRLSPETDATELRSYSGLAVTPYKEDAHNADFQSVLYYETSGLENATYCYAVAGNARITEDSDNGRHLCHLEMPAAFTQTANQEPDFLRDHMYMYATTSYKGKKTRFDFNHIPATFRFVVTNTTDHDIVLQELSISASSKEEFVASKSTEVSLGWSDGGADCSFGTGGHNRVAVAIDNGTVAAGEDYIAYALALPLPDNGAFNGKTLNFSVKSDNKEVIAFQLDGAKLAEINGSDVYNWVSGNSYTIKINVREENKAMGEILDGNRIAVAPDTEGIYTLVYEGEDGQPLADYAGICTLTAKELAYYEDFIDPNIAPRAAGNIGIYNSAWERQGSILLDNFKPDFTDLPLYSFGLLSDVHIGRSNINSEVDFERALKHFNAKGVALNCICGDITQNGKEAELTSYKDLIALSDAPVYTTSGNHDATTGGINPELWTKYTGLPLVFERSVECGGKVDHFLFLGMERWKFSAAYLDYHLTWLESKLEEYRNERCFVITHLFFPDRAGNLNNIYPSYNWLSGLQLEALEAMCDRYVNSIWFSGHSHWEWGLQKYQDRANLYRTYVASAPASGWCVHVPSCGAPITSNGSTRVDNTAGSEGAVVEVYKDHVDILGIDFISGKYLPVATYRLDTSIQEVSADNKERANHYISAKDFVVNQGKRPGATVTDVEGMPDYVEVTFTTKPQGFYVANHTYTDNATKVSITVEDVQAMSNGKRIDIPAGVGFNCSTGYNLVSTNSAYVTNRSQSATYRGVQFQTSESKYGDGPLPLTLRLKVQMSYSE